MLTVVPMAAPTPALAARAGVSQTTTHIGTLDASFTAPSNCSNLLQIATQTQPREMGPGLTVTAGYGWEVDSKGTSRQAPSCVPSGLTQAGTDFFDPTFSIFSPGTACPSGFHAACILVAAGAAPAVNAKDSTTVWSLAGDSTVTGCCPSGFGCASQDHRQCIETNGRFFQRRDMRPMSVSVGVWDTSKHALTTTQYYMARMTTATIYAQRVLYVSSEKGANSTASSASSSTTTNKASSSPSSSAAAASDAGSGGLSTAAKAAISTIIPLILIFAAVAAFVLLRRRRRQRNNNATEATEAAKRSGSNSEDDEKPGLPPKAELDSTVSALSAAHFSGKAELDGTPCWSSPTSSTLGSTVYELPGDASIASSVVSSASRGSSAGAREERRISRKPAPCAPF